MTKGLVQLVTGGRTYRDRGRVFAELDQVHHDAGPIVLLVHGAAPWADLHAEAWAKDREVDYRGCPARWKKYQKSAGPVRNRLMQRLMVEYRERGYEVRCLAFPGGVGTANMVKLCEEQGILVKRVK